LKAPSDLLPYDNNPYFHGKHEQLRANGVNTYGDLYALLRQRDADEELLKTACYLAHGLKDTIDRRRAVPALLVALQSQSRWVRRAAIYALSCWSKSQQVYETLVRVATDKHEDVGLRGNAIQSIGLFPKADYLSLARQLIWDRTNDVYVRSQAIEWLQHEDLFEDYVQLLDEPEADIRFWVAYVFSQLWSVPNMSRALESLDKIAAFDHRLPETWGWHVDREAFRALENVSSKGRWYGTIWLISPAPEYDTLSRQYREMQDNARYSTKPLPEVTLRIEPDWLQQGITQRWPKAQFNTRQPRLQTYILDWQLKIGRWRLNGGLHRDGYGVMLRARCHEAVFAFAAWYRSIVTDTPLYLYEWADEAIDLYPHITADEIVVDNAMRDAYYGRSLSERLKENE
jgi:HEAT repeats